MHSEASKKEFYLISHLKQ